MREKSHQIILADQTQRSKDFNESLHLQNASLSSPQVLL